MQITLPNIPAEIEVLPPYYDTQRIPLGIPSWQDGAKSWECPCDLPHWHGELATAFAAVPDTLRALCAVWDFLDDGTPDSDLPPQEISIRRVILAALEKAGCTVEL